MKVKELMERKQGPHESFSDYVSDMHNLHFKLKHKIAEDGFVEQRKDTRGRYEDGQGCRGPLHALVCYKCGKEADFYRKHPAKEEFCSIKFHDATCRFCEKVGTDADANPVAFARSPSGKTGIAGRTMTNPFR